MTYYISLQYLQNEITGMEKNNWKTYFEMRQWHIHILWMQSHFAFIVNMFIFVKILLTKELLILDQIMDLMCQWGTQGRFLYLFIKVIDFNSKDLLLVYIYLNVKVVALLYKKIGNKFPTLLLNDVMTYWAQILSESSRSMCVRWVRSM